MEDNETTLSNDTDKKPEPSRAEKDIVMREVLKPLRTKISDSLVEEILAKLDRREITQGAGAGWYEGTEGFRKLLELELAYSMGATDEKACGAAGITLRQLDYYQTKINPNFIEEKKIRKTNPSYKALITVYEHLDDIEVSQWYLGKKMKDEFGEAPTPVIPSGNTMINVTNKEVNNIYTPDLLEIPDTDVSLLENPEVKNESNQAPT